MISNVQDDGMIGNHEVISFYIEQPPDLLTNFFIMLNIADNQRMV